MGEYLYEPAAEASPERFVRGRDASFRDPRHGEYQAPFELQRERAADYPRLVSAGGYGPHENVWDRSSPPVLREKNYDCELEFRKAPPRIEDLDDVPSSLVRVEVEDHLDYPPRFNYFDRPAHRHGISPTRAFYSRGHAA